MPMNFPDNPSVNDEFTNDMGRTWIWTGTTWKSKTVNIQLQIDTAIAQEVVNRNLAIADGVSDANLYTDNSVTPVANDLSDLTTEFNNHAIDTTNVHGIVDTADLVVTADLATKQDVVTGVSDTEISYLSNVTSDIQSQINGKANSIHAHGISDVTNLSTELGGKASAIHTHVSSDITDFSTQLATKADTIHSHAISDVTNLQTELSGKASTTHTHAISDVTNLSTQLEDKANVLHVHTISDVTGLQTELDDKADAIHSHAISDVTNLQTSLDGKADTVHGHAISDVTDLQTSLDAKANLSGATFTGDLEIPNVTITGNLLVQGTTTTINTTDYAVRDNMIYLNQAGVFTVTNAVGNGTIVTYTAPNHDFQAGDYIVITGINPSVYNIAGTSLLTIDSVNGDDFVVTKSDTGTYVSGGTARGKSAANPDLGWAAGRTTVAGYGHTGFFRDASDATYKIFDGYTPEPDESLFIDTSHASFALAPLAISALTTGNITATGTVDLSSATVSGVSLDDLSDVTQTSAASGDVLYFDGSGWVNKYVNEIPAKTNNATVTSNNYDLVASDAGKIVEVSNSVATTVTIPSSESYPVGTQIIILQTGAGQITVNVQTPASQTLNYSPGNKIRGQWAAATLLKRATNSWVLYGDLAS